MTETVLSPGQQALAEKFAHAGEKPASPELSAVADTAAVQTLDRAQQALEANVKKEMQDETAEAEVARGASKIQAEQDALRQQKLVTRQGVISRFNASQPPEKQLPNLSPPKPSTG